MTQLLKKLTVKTACHITVRKGGNMVAVALSSVLGIF